MALVRSSNVNRTVLPHSKKELTGSRSRFVSSARRWKELMIMTTKTRWSVRGSLTTRMHSARTGWLAAMQQHVPDQGRPVARVRASTRREGTSVPSTR